MCGFSLKKRCLRAWQEILGRICLRKQWRRAQRLGLILTTGFFRIRTQCPKAASEILSRCRFKSTRASLGIVFFSTSSFSLMTINGNSWLRWLEFHERERNRLPARLNGVDESLESDSHFRKMTMTFPGQKDPPIVGDLPNAIELVLGDQIYLAKEQLPPGVRNRLIRLAAFQNPEFYRAQAMRLPTFGKPRIIHCAEETPKYLALPRGCLDGAKKLLSDLRIEPTFRDERVNGTPLDVTFQGELRPEI